MNDEPTHVEPESEPIEVSPDESPFVDPEMEEFLGSDQEPSETIDLTLEEDA